jgi:hypothetical protein
VKKCEQALQEAIAKLRCDAVSINHWPALIYGFISPPWGGFSGSKRSFGWASAVEPFKLLSKRLVGLANAPRG